MLIIALFVATLQQILEETAIECDSDEMTHIHWCNREVSDELIADVHTAIEICV